jgi:hypothetical protein
VHRSPARVGGNDVAVAGVNLPCNQIAGWNNRAVGERTEALFEERVEPSEIIQKPVVKVWNPAVDAVPRCRAAGVVRVPQAGGDDEDFAISAHGQQLKIGLCTESK